MSVCEPGAALAAVSDDDVMACVEAGSAAALGVLYDRYRDRAYRVAWSVCRDAGGADEAVQEAFLSIWKTRVTYDRQVGQVAPWVLTVVRYRAIDVARRHRRHAEQRASEDILRTVRAPDGVLEQVTASAEGEDVLSLLAGLPDAQREVITLAFYGQLTYSEIACHLGLPTGTVKGRIRLALQRLRGEITRIAG